MYFRNNWAELKQEGGSHKVKYGQRKIRCLKNVVQIFWMITIKPFAW